MNTNTTRNTRYDFYKGMLMFGVVYGHMLGALHNGSADYSIYAFIRTYDMPMFAFISGFFLYSSLQRNSLKDNILKKIGGILLPSLLWEFIPSLLTGNFHFVPAGFWFTYSLFFCLLIIILIESFFKSEICKMIAYIINILLFHTLIKEPYNIGFLLAPAIVGLYYNKHINSKSSKRFPLISFRFHKPIVIFLFLLAFCFWTTNYNVWNTGCCVLREGETFKQIAKVLFRFSIGILGIFSMKYFFDYLYDSSAKSQYIQVLVNSAIPVGTATIEIYILQCFAIRTIKKCVSRMVDLFDFNPFIWNEKLLLLILAPALTVALIYVLFYIQKTLKRIPIIGRFFFSIPLHNLHLNYQKR